MSLTELMKPTLSLVASVQQRDTTVMDTATTTPQLLLPPPPSAKNSAGTIYNTNNNNNNNNNAPQSTPGRPKLQQQNSMIATTIAMGTPIATGIAATIKTEKEKNEIVTTPAGKLKPPSKGPDEFWKDLYQFQERRGTPINHVPKISGKPVDLFKLYNEVTERGGFNKVNNRDEWDEVYACLETLHDKCVNGTAAIKHIYRRYLDKYERLNYFGEDPDKMEALEAAIENAESASGRSRGRYSQLSSGGFSSIFGNQYANLNAVPMSYNHRQHIVNMDRRRQFKLSTDLHKGTPLEKLMLSLISPLPNEQDFAINVCTLMTNEPKNQLRLSECPKIVDVLLAHTGVFADYTVRKLFQHVYTNIRRHSQYAFWRDLLHDKPQVLELHTDEQAWLDNGLITPSDLHKEDAKRKAWLDDCYEVDFLNLGRGLGTQDYMGQRVLQVVQVLRNLSFFDENLLALAKNRTFWRFLVMGANVRWNNIHIQALETAGNVATEFELLDPTTDELSRNLMATLCEGIESLDRGVIINCLEILYKLSMREGNEENVNKCLNLEFYRRLTMLLSLNDVMLLIFTLETIYALTSLGARSCSLLMQVRGIIDQLVALITVEAQSYGPDGCILMRVVEIVPGNMLPMVAQNIANIQNVAALKTPQLLQLPPAAAPVAVQAHHLDTGAQQHTVIVQNPQQPTQQPPQQPLQQPPQQPTQQPTQQTPQQPVVEQHVAPPTTVPPTLPQPSLPQVQLPPGITSATTPLTPQSNLSPNEQYACAWLRATFESTPNNESLIEQNELFYMYVMHCNKTGKFTAVNYAPFSRLVRLVFNQSVGPMVVKRPDGSEQPGFHYVGIRLRAQPLPIQHKIIATAVPVSPKIETVQSARKKKKFKAEPMTVSTPPQETADKPVESAAPETATPTAAAAEVKLEPKVEPIAAPTATSNNPTAPPEQSKADPPEAKMEVCAAETNAQPSPQITPALQQQPQQQQQQHSTTSLIKSLLANKVNQRQQKQKELQPSAASITSDTPQLQPQPPPQQQQPQSQPANQPIKVTSNAISALVNNPLMHHTPVKVGQTTIKPLNPQHTIEKKPLHSESVPPPLAPLSGSNVVTKDPNIRTVIIANQALELPASLLKRKLTIDDSHDHVKRMSMDNSNSAIMAAPQEPQVTPSKNAANLYAEMAASILEDEDLDDIPPLTAATTQQQAAPEPTPPPKVQQQILIPAKMQLPQSTVANIQRQILFQANATPQTVTASAGQQLKLTSALGQQQIPTAMATIKTDQGLQTVPVILQSKALEQSQPTTQLIQQVIQQAPLQQQPQTQYVLATNQQGQTYLVAQQTQPQPPQQPTQTVLVTQTPQQQSAGTKTIIILQQQTMPAPNANAHGAQTQQIITTGPVVGGAQKMIMTTAQGQQVLVTQRPPTPQQQQIFINPQTGAATHIQHVSVPVSAAGTVTNVVNNAPTTIIQRQLGPPATQQTNAPAQISPSLLSQLNQIPATIKLHQPQPSAPMTPQAPQQATISRIGGKTVQLVQSTPSNQPVQIPQLQQHQSIIQQHIISGPSDKRQMLLAGGGRAIEIKETLITQTPAPVQQSQLNSQTIITTQPVTQHPQTVLQPQQPPPQHQQQQQQQQHIRTVIEHQQPQHPSIIQQKITVPIAAAQAVTAQQSPVATQLVGSVVSKSLNEMPSLVQTVSKPPTVTIQQNIQIKPPSTTPVAIAAKKIQPVMEQPAKPATQPPVQQQQTPAPQTAVSEPTASNANRQAIPSEVKEAKPEEKPQPPVSRNAPTPPAAPTQAPTVAPPVATSQPPTTLTPAPAPPPATTHTSALVPADVNWLFICDWRNCPRRKFKSLNDLQHHVCTIHCPDHLDNAAEIFCQWGTGPGLCDNIPRKRFSLMTHLIDRHLTMDSLRAAVQRRIATGIHNVAPAQPPVTIVRNVEHSQRMNTASPALSTGSSTSSSAAAAATLPATNIAGSSALHAIKRHTADFMNSKELMDENEGPVTKSIRLTAALILRNLVVNTSMAKRNLRRYEPHLANAALSNVESSATLSQILFELNN